jgi:hypothetical protein
MSQKLLKVFEFCNDNRARLTLSDSTKIRLNAETNQIELVIQSYEPATGKAIYPLDTDLTVTTWLASPSALLEWLSFAVEPRAGLQPVDEAGAAVTSLGFKLNDGTDDRYWDGAAWSVAGATDWSTEAEIATNISTFPATPQKLAVVACLATTDKYQAPTLKSIDVLMDIGIEDYIESLIHDALVGSMKASIRPVFSYGLAAPGGAVLKLKKLEQNVNIVSVQGVYDHEADPKHRTSLVSSYNSASLNITLTGSVARGTKLWVDLVIEPEVFVNFGDQDYIEVHKIPAVVLESIDFTGNSIYGTQVAKDIGAGTASVRKMPLHLDIEISVRLIAGDTRTLMRMRGKALEHGANTPLLLWEQVDDETSMRITNEGSFNPRPNLEGVHDATYGLVLEDFTLWLRPEETKYLIQSVKTTMTQPRSWSGVRPIHP